MRRGLLAGTVVASVVLSGLLYAPTASAEETLAVKADISAPEEFLDTSGQPLTVASDTGQETDVRTLTGSLSDGTPFSEQIYYGMRQNLQVGDTEAPASEDSPVTGLEAQTIVARTATTISASWRSDGDGSTFEMFLDDTSLGQQDSPTFTVRGLSPSTVYSLRLNSTTPASETEVQTFDEAAFQAKVDAKLQELQGSPTGEPSTDPTAEPTGEPSTDPTAEPTGEPSTDPTAEPTGEPSTDPTAEPSTPATAVRPARTATSTLSIETLPSASALKARVLVAGGGTSSVDSTDFTYRTFIPWRTISEGGGASDQTVQKACLALASATYQIPGAVSDTLHMTFLGDNRSFQQPQESDDHPFRTQTRIHVNWDESTSSTDKEPGYTRVLDENTGEVVAEKRADMGNVKFSRWGDLDKGYVRYNILHVANDPFCPHASVFGSITYNVNVDLYSTGLVKIYGWQYTMPSHEAWVRWNHSTTWNNLFTSNATHLYCLIGGGFVEPTGDPSQEPTVCSQPVEAHVNRSLDRWTSVVGGPTGLRAGLTKTGRIWMTGYGSFVHPYALGDSSCRVNELVSPYRDREESPGKLTVAYGTGLLLGANGALKSWGDGLVGGQPGMIQGDSLATVDGTYRDVVTVRDTAWAVNSDGNIATWGFNTDYEKAGWDAENGLAMYNETPTVVSSGHDFEQVVATAYSLTALDSDGHVWQRQDANGQGTTYSVPAWSWVRIDGGHTFTSIASSWPGVWALDSDGALWLTDNLNYGTEFHEIPGTSGYVKLEPSDMGPMVTVGSDGSSDSWAEGWASGADAQAVTTPDTSGDVLDYYTFLASNGDLYARSTEFDPDTGEAKESWIDVGVPPTKVRTPEEVSYTCEFPT
jgi:hypothetical protein